MLKRRLQQLYWISESSADDEDTHGHKQCVVAIVDAELHEDEHCNIHSDTETEKSAEGAYAERGAEEDDGEWLQLCPSHDGLAFAGGKTGSPKLYNSARRRSVQATRKAGASLGQRHSRIGNSLPRLSTLDKLQQHRHHLSTCHGGDKLRRCSPRA